MQTSQHSAWHAIKPSFPFQKCLNDSPFPTEQNTEASKIYLVLNCLSRLTHCSFPIPSILALTGLHPAILSGPSERASHHTALEILPGNNKLTLSFPAPMIPYSTSQRKRNGFAQRLRFLCLPAAKQALKR